MANNKKVHFGPDYEYDSSKSKKDNWEAMKDFYKQYDIEVGEMPPDDSEIDELFDKMLPSLMESFQD